MDIKIKKTKLQNSTNLQLAKFKKHKVKIIFKLS